MFKKILKSLTTSILVAILIFILAIAAAPFFVRDEQVKNFVEKHVILPKGDKLELQGNVRFSILPKMYVQAEAARVLKSNGSETTYKNLYLGFNTADLFRKGISFDMAFAKDKSVFEGKITIDDYSALLHSRESIVTMDITKPLPMKIRGNLSRPAGNTYMLDDFRISHKQSLATGNMKIVEQEGTYTTKLDTVIETSNLDDIRRLLDFANYNDDFNQLSGSGTLNLNLQSVGRNPQEMKDHINGKGSLAISHAEIYGIDLNEILGKNKTELRERNDIKINITSGNSLFDIRNSIVYLNSITADNNLAHVEGKGTVDLVQRQLDIDTDINANIIYAQADIPLTITGNFDDVKFISRSSPGDTGGNKINLKNVKIDIDPKNMKNNLEKLKDIGKSFGLDLNKFKHKKNNTAEPAASAE